MKNSIPESLVINGHRDFALLSALAEEILRRGGGKDRFALNFAMMLRDCVDAVIMTPKTGRRSYEELEKTEKTYIGTRVEIELRALLQLPKGKLDTIILGYDVDIKHTMGSHWMIPMEAVDKPCILVAADEKKAKCYMGLFVARLEYLTISKNRDAKRNVSASGFQNIYWLINGRTYPANFWRAVNPETVRRIFDGKSGNNRMATLFREVCDTPIDREVVAAVAKQKDFTRRIRSDKGRGTRDVLAEEGVLLLSGDYDAALIAALRLPFCKSGEFISHRVTSPNEAEIAAAHGVNVALSANP